MVYKFFDKKTEGGTIKSEITFNKESAEELLGEGNLIFYCMGPTNPKCWQIKAVIILISRIFQYDIFF